MKRHLKTGTAGLAVSMMCGWLAAAAWAQSPAANADGGSGGTGSAVAGDATGGSGSAAAGDATDTAGGQAPSNAGAAGGANSPAPQEPNTQGSTAPINSKEAGPPIPVTTGPLPYPELAARWLGVTLTPSISEKFNDKLPYWLRFSGEFRERFEGTDGASFKYNATNDYDLQRIRLAMMIKPLNWLRFDIQTQDAREFGITPGGPPYQKDWDIREAYVLIGNPEGNGFTIKAGRQDMSFGNNRFIGDSWWTNVSRSFDGVRAAYQYNKYRLDVFATSVVIIRDGVIDHHEEGNNLYGAYFTAKDLIPRSTLDVYEFWNIRPSFALVNFKTNGHLDEWTTGVRWVGALPYNMDYRTEMAIQRGTLTPDKIRAWTGHWSYGYTFKDAPIEPRIFLEYDYASGSQNTKDGVDSTFDPIYPSTHDKLGLADAFGWRNIQDLRFGQDYRLSRKWRAATSFHDFWLANAHDALYPTRGSVIALSATGVDGTHVAEELDAQIIYTPTRQTQIGAGYGHVIPAEFLKKATQGHSFTYPYMLCEYVF